VFKCQTTPVHTIPLKKNNNEQSRPDQQTQQPAVLSWVLPSSGSPKGKKYSKAPHINDRSTVKHFAEIIMPLLVETNNYSYCHLDTLRKGPSLLPGITEAKIFVFLIIIQS
jgi:hypothetical protein